jgi:hypothetical protein
MTRCRDEEPQKTGEKAKKTRGSWAFLFLMLFFTFWRLSRVTRAHRARQRDWISVAAFVSRFPICSTKTFLSPFGEALFSPSPFLKEQKEKDCANGGGTLVSLERL